MNPQQYYTSQSICSDPGHYAAYFEDLPEDVPSLCAIIQALFMHPADGDIFDYSIPSARFAEMDDRYASVILANIVKKNPGSLIQKRSLEQRQVGVCRDMALLVCAILRHRGIPARLRVGFADYVIPRVYLDVLLLEYWDAKAQRWVLADARIAPVHIKKLNLQLDFSMHDIPRERVVLAEQAWQLCRTGAINPIRFGSRSHRGLWYVRNRLLQSIVFILKCEMLIWDLWGMMLGLDKPTVLPDQFPILDELSEFLLNNEYAVDRIQTFYDSRPALHVPDTVMVYNPHGEPYPTQVKL